MGSHIVDTLYELENGIIIISLLIITLLRQLYHPIIIMVWS